MSGIQEEEKVMSSQNSPATPNQDSKHPAPSSPASETGEATAPELAKGEKKPHWLQTESEHVIPKVS